MFKTRGTWNWLWHGLGKAEETLHHQPVFRVQKASDGQPSCDTGAASLVFRAALARAATLDQDLGDSFTVDWVMRRAGLRETRTCVLEGCLCLMVQEARWHFMWFSQL